ncbi:zinc ribbon domain-containing protein [Paenisporosarcina sp. TG-14]|uniref:zinc ribbon domain-containing protein n=1 Tax=Paenisporosarcina sp. TG-14 TaxID=1231057 RepID=UPI0002DF6532|nr:zinc ribbon domain-containing protein [Paenisporosarcina sp. TG-14]
MHCTNCSETISEQAEICPKCGVRTFKVKKYCHGCGKSVNENQEICVACGISLNGTNVEREPWLMAVLSFLILGLGQIIMGQTAKGLTILAVGFFIGFITVGISSFIIVPISVIDAYLIAKKKKDGKVVGEWEFF